MAELSSRVSKRTLSISCKISIAINLLLLVTILGIQLYMNGTFHNHHRETNEEIPRTRDISDSDVLCIPCDDLGSGVTYNDTLYDDIVTTSCGHRVCCIKDQKYLINLVKKMTYAGTLDARNGNELLWWRQRENAAHVYLKTPVDNPPITWTAEDETGTAFSKLAMTSSGERLIIPRTGLYFVYAVFSFDFSGHVGTSGRIPQIYHNITMEHPLLKRTGQRALLMSKYGGMNSDDKTYTSFVCGVFDLQNGFEIGTHASNIDVIDFSSKYKNFFGIFQVHV
ncbi:hypothetical protein FSP39_009672 [Pinctada imbricata]|uniref:THD domain-containing protein n=1 Tax=Pinctada imbricata TaxID=66713 RepID=A0AA88XUY1_PINIB|nr:hypothetical protein FSP39_009672 [Pinctada imbricata]